MELRLPTGDSDELRGTGVTRTLVSAIWSRGGKVAPHANAGYEFWSSKLSLTQDVYVKNQMKYAFGVEVQPHPLLTLLVDVVGRRSLHGGRTGYETVSVPGGTIDLLVPIPEGLNVISLAPGLKWNIWRGVLLNADLLVSLANKGLRADTTPVVGFDWAF